MRHCKFLIPAIVMIWPALASADDYGVNVSFDPTNRNWSGLVITNTGEKPLTLTQVVLNSRPDCLLKPFDLQKVRGASSAFNSLVLISAGFETGHVFLPDTPRTDKIVAPDDRVVLQVGDRIAILNQSSPCRNVIRVTLTAEEASFDGDLSIPYSGNPAIDQLNKLFNNPDDGADDGIVTPP
jgi:hypothetical protein